MPPDIREGKGKGNATSLKGEGVRGMSPAFHLPQASLSVRLNWKTAHHSIGILLADGFT